MVPFYEPVGKAMGHRSHRPKAPNLKKRFDDYQTNGDVANKNGISNNHVDFTIRTAQRKCRDKQVEQQTYYIILLQMVQFQMTNKHPSIGIAAILHMFSQRHHRQFFPENR